MKLTTALFATVALALSACSASDDTRNTATDPAATQSAAATTDDSALSEEPGRPPAATGTPLPSAAETRNTLSLEGLGDLAVGNPVPSGSSFAERGGQIDGPCRTISSPDYPGVYAITEGGQVRRITVGERSDVKLVEGIGVGATVADVMQAFPGFRSTPHKYVSAPARYLTQPGDNPRLRFEIGENGRVNLIHVGVMPQLGYVEGCA